MKNRVLVLGSTGFIGKNLTNFLVSENYPVIGLSTSRCNFSNLNSFKKSTKNIISNSTVIFCAGKHRQYGDNIKNYNLNKNIIKNLLIIFKSQKPKKIIFFSTVEVYGNKFLKKIDEGTKINPLNLYAKGKYEQELLIKKFCIKHKIKFNILRIPGIFGKQDNNTSFILSYSYGRALQQSALKFWSKNIQNIEGTQKVFNHRAKMNTLAAQGKWSKDLEV